MNSSPAKQKVQALYKKHVSSAKTEFFEKNHMDFVMGPRSGPWLWDMDKKKHLYDLHCNGGVFNLGHKNSQLIEILKNSLDEIDIGNHHLLSNDRAQLAALISEHMPGNLNYTVFGVSGGEAVDLALKIARGFTGKSGIISAIGGYHGHTGLAIAAGDSKYRDSFGPFAPGFTQVEFGDFEDMKNACSGDTAAIILETIPATSGIIIPDIKYLQQVQKLCREKNILLILDEVQTGLGRTGKLWAFEHFEIEPDIVVLGKGLSGGIYPLSATVFRSELESVFFKDPFKHISTFGGAELGCRIGKKVLEISCDPVFLKQVNNLSDLLNKGLKILMAEHSEFFTGIRRLGLMMGLVLKNKFAGPILTKTAFDQDLLIVFANNDSAVCQFLPPLIILEKDIDIILNKLGKALSAAEIVLSEQEQAGT